MTVWTESFNKADNGLGPDLSWTSHSGTHGVRSNVARALTGTHNVAGVPAASFSNGYAQAEVLTSLLNHGPALRITDGSNYYMMRRNTSTRVQVYKRVSGTFTLLSSITHTTSPGDTFKIEMNGTSWEAFVNGTSIGTGTDSAHASGEAGLYSTSTSREWDNFEASDGDDPDPPVSSGAVSYRRTHMTGNVHR